MYYILIWIFKHSINIFKNKLKELLTQDKIFFWYSGHTYDKIINDKHYYGLC